MALKTLIFVLFNQCNSVQSLWMLKKVEICAYQWCMRTINLMVRNVIFVIFTQNITWSWIFSTILTLLKCSIRMSAQNVQNSNHLDICISLYKVIGHRYNHEPVYTGTIPLLDACFCLVHYLILSFCTDNMALYIMVLCNVLFYFLFYIFILQCLIMPHK